MSRASLLCVLVACASFCGAVAPMSGQGVVQQAPAPTPAPVPSWCNGLACPAFTVLRAGAGWGLRRYEASTWVSTAIEGVNYGKANNMAFDRLFNYIQANGIAMTTPVLTQVQAGSSVSCGSNFTTSFYVAPGPAPPPPPSADDVFIQTMPEMEVYVSTFTGWANEKRVVAQAAQLSEALSKAGIVVGTTTWWTAQYDSPFRLTDRHNEVWLAAAGQ